ncbi:MAG: LCP family protein [Lachnospiraceae bacterium]
MDYRDQLKYIKSHQNEEYEADVRRRQRKKSKDMNKIANTGKRNSKKGKKPDKPKKIGVFNHLLWIIQFFASLFFMLSMFILNILPKLYIVAVAALIILLLIFVKYLQKRACRSRKKRGSGKILSILVSVLLISVGFYGMKVNAALDKIAIGEDSGEYSEEHTLSVTDQPFNIYISGIDVYGNITKESRSDVNLIATINPVTHKILLTTTPRDYYVVIPGVSGEQRDKLTHAGTYGVNTSMATLENLYDTEIPFYIRVNFTSVEEIVDVMGGIDVESELAFTTSKAAGEVVDVKKGMNHFNGKQALAFVRERKALATGDNQRGKNQQALLTALIKKAISPAIIFQANSMINSVAGNAETNLSEAQIKSLIRMQIGKMEGWDIESVAAEGDDRGKQYCYSYSGAPLYVTVPYESSVNEIKEKIKKTCGK